MCSNLYIFVLVLIGVHRHYANVIYVVPGLGEGTLQHFSTKLSVTDSSKELKEQAIYYSLYCWI